MRHITTSSIIIAADFRLTSRSQNSGTLTIVFTSCKMYRYRDVPKELYQRFLAAESKGKFFNQFIRGKFEYKEKGLWTAAKGTARD